MGFYSCPHCGKSTASFLYYCGLFMFAPQNECDHCHKQIQTNPAGFLSFYIFAISFLLISHLFTNLLPESSKSIGMGIAIGILVVGQGFIPHLNNKLFGTHLFTKKGVE